MVKSQGSSFKIQGFKVQGSKVKRLRVKIQGAKVRGQRSRFKGQGIKYQALRPRNCNKYRVIRYSVNLQYNTLFMIDVCI